jgi:two-component system LytT family sensor kinase
MMRIVKYRYFSFIVHALLWSIVLLFPYFISSAGDRYKIGPLPGGYFTLSQVVHIIIFYSNSFLLYPKLLNRTYWWLYIPAVVLLIALSVGVKFYILTIWFPNDLADVRTHMLIPSVMVFIVSIFYSITVEKVRTEKKEKENEAVKLAMELQLLRSQISPHFLFNILTNLVSLARKRSGDLETSLLMLSGLMRYMLYDASKRISLQQEVEYLESYIALQKLRFGRDVNIILNIEISQEEASNNIEPMLLIPFVENAFKHGTGYADQPFIHMNLRVSNGILVFKVKNKYEEGTATSKDETSGIGLNNVRSRLTLLYPQRHELVIEDGNNLFNVNLTLQLL